MIEIYPTLTSSFSKCPVCGCQLSTPSDLRFFGQFIMADILCSCCDIEYFHTYPSLDNQDLTSIAFSKEGKYLKYKSETNKWKARLLAHFATTLTKINNEFEVELQSPGQKIVLYNFLFYTPKEVETAFQKTVIADNAVILIFASHKNCINCKVKEIWFVETEPQEDVTFINGLDKFIKDQFGRFERVQLWTGPRSIQKVKLSSKIKFWISSIMKAVLNKG